MKNQANHTNQNNQGLSRPSGSSGNLKPLYNTTIPNDWEIRELRNEIEELEAGVSVNSVDDESFVDDYFILKTSAVSDGLFFPNECKKILLRDKGRAKLNPKRNSIIISRMNTPALVGECGYVEETYQNLFLPDRLWQTKFKKNSQINVKWLNYILNTPDYKLKIKSSATGTSNSMKNISKEVFLSLKIPLPPLPEQQAIANLLSTWDEAIAKHNQLIAQKEQHKKWLMQKLLTGKKRLKGFEKVKWSFVRFNEIYSQVKEKAGNRKYIVLSVTKDGIVSQSEYFKKEIASEDTSPYLIMKKGDMVMSGLNFWMGSIDVLTQFDSGIVSPAYRVFEITNNSIDPDFMKFFVRSQIMLEALIGSSVIGASTVRRNLDRETLDEWAFHLPSVEEQTAIAAVLHTADKEIQLLKAKTEKLREQKKGLMQLLLTGKKRLKINAHEYI